MKGHVDTGKTNKNCEQMSQCRHDMRPSVQLPSMLGVDSKLRHRITTPLCVFVEIFNVR